MARRKYIKQLPRGEFSAHIESLTLEGRGVAHLDGKATFIGRALPGEDVRFVYRDQRRHFDLGDAVAVDTPSPERIEPGCPHFHVCGGCAMQHLAPQAQVAHKQQALLDQLSRIGRVEPEQVLAPLTGPIWGYRRMARLGVRYVRKKGRALVGFRELGSALITDIDTCPVLDPRVGEKLPAIAELIGAMDARRDLPQIEVGCGDTHCALAFRNMVPLTEADRARLDAFADAHGFAVFLQPGGPETLEPLVAGARDVYPSYRLNEFDVEIRFSPLDFAQVNADINQRMVHQALDWLAVQPGDRVLDLFAGLGNFSLPLARKAGTAGSVTAVEADAAMVERGAACARDNGIETTRHVVGNLFEPHAGHGWLGESFERILLDPPRAGAEAMMPVIARMRPERVVYVSCHPGSLARDVGRLVHEYGWRLLAAGVMDMFPHTAHVESMAVLEPG
ncbi:23S rRNA (uracil(1939)-C(5))-methyltransferase RlmD [Guyparkeria sp. SB14A]|uniref:23S rRNA (uracil(1939)-C(5))-methyltransferase RlmD n=1 Tax=Guyparkeria sp. SB14A TaxID=2571147 RepID=UPI0010AD8C00|nr:23S rRNA (uracil(1939)-C(5))-methyltransferase RlmD [Guyparkeria sp. SB14A]TKA91148.1 23S rRNA (uracil(1939)-C(5))-methyltransferase RlmD [Guyparkeria sp. SB14A]